MADPLDGSERGERPHETVLDVKRLDRKESKRLLEHVLDSHGAHRDHSVLLDKVRSRLDRVGILPPSVEVRFENLCVETNTVVAARQVPSLFKAVGGGVFSPKEEKARRTRLKLLAPCSGVLRPGRLCLILGPPGSGRTTFLRALAGRAQEQHDLHVSGHVTYNGRSLDTFKAPRAAAYISQADLHYGELTVRETLAFSASCQGAGYQRELLKMLVEREGAAGVVPDPEVDAFMKASAWNGSNTVGVELTLKLLGLEGAADTVVGNSMLRGISGGEKVHFFVIQHYCVSLEVLSDFKCVDSFALCRNEPRLVRPWLALHACSLPMKFLLVWTRGRRTMSSSIFLAGCGRCAVQQPWRSCSRHLRQWNSSMT